MLNSKLSAQSKRLALIAGRLPAGLETVERIEAMAKEAMDLWQGRHDPTNVRASAAELPALLLAQGDSAASILRTGGEDASPAKTAASEVAGLAYADYAIAEESARKLQQASEMYMAVAARDALAGKPVRPAIELAWDARRDSAEMALNMCLAAKALSLLGIAAFCTDIDNQVKMAELRFTERRHSANTDIKLAKDENLLDYIL